MSIPDSIYNDSRYIDIGDLPTGFAPYEFDCIYIRPFCVRELNLLNKGHQQGLNGIVHVIRAVNMTISCDVRELTDGDFHYVCAWLRMYSYPKAPSLVNWTCKKVNVVECEGKAAVPDQKHALSISDDELMYKGWEREVCESPNVEIVHNTKTNIISLDDDDLTIEYDELDFPRIDTLVDYLKIKEEEPENEHLARCARWVAEGKSLKEKMDVLLNGSIDMYTHIVECMSRYNHGITEDMELRCRACGNTVKYTSFPNVATFFADNSEQNVMDMQYALMVEFGIQPDDNMPVKTLLYHHSCLAKDKQAEKERANLRKAAGGK